MVTHPKRTSFCTVRGDSINDVGLLNGDVVVVEHNTATKSGDIVVAVMDGKVAVKTLALEHGHYVRPGESL